MLLLYQFITVIAVFVLDRLTKISVKSTLGIYESKPVLNDILSLEYVLNEGAAFSMLEGKTVILIAVPVIASAIMIYLLAAKKIRSRIGSWGLALILGGALGNLYDRAFMGAVVDMFKLEFIDFPVFNVADIAVTVGAVLFFVYMLFFYEDKAEKKDE